MNKVFFIFIIILFSCESKQENSESVIPELQKVEDSEYEKVFLDLLVSFKKEVIKFKDRKGINLVGYVKIVPISRSEYKITLMGLSHKDLKENFQVDEVFRYAGLFWCVDYEFEGLKTKSNQLKKDVIKASRIEEFFLPDSRQPNWLALIKDHKLFKLNTYARGRILNFDKTKLKYELIPPKLDYQIDEWGNIINKNGDTTGKYTGQDTW